jgi:hypothetical protein
LLGRRTREGRSAHRRRATAQRGERTSRQRRHAPLHEVTPSYKSQRSVRCDVVHAASTRVARKHRASMRRTEVCHHVLERQAHRSSASRGLARCSSTPSPTALPRLESAGRGLCRSCSRADEGREREWKGRAPATERAAGCTRTDACSCNHPPPPPPSHQAVHITTEREERRETRRSRGERQT